MTAASDRGPDTPRDPRLAGEPAPHDAVRDREARRLQAAWEQRAQSPARDFFVASHPGWDDPAAWAAQARHDADFLLQQLRTPLATAQVLEIGCGVGRLVPVLAPAVAAYTGFDIAPSMVAEARARHAAFANARFLVGDGLSVPAGARDRRYDLALAHAVFIHCPREVIAALIADCWTLLAEGGELRFQLRADPADDTPLAVLPDVPAARDAAATVHTPGTPRTPGMRGTSAARDVPGASGAPDVPGAPAVPDAGVVRAAAGQEAEGRVAVPAAHAPLVDQQDYMGATFRSADVVPFLAALPGLQDAEIAAVRVDRLHIYAAARRAPPAANHPARGASSC